MKINFLVKYIPLVTFLQPINFFGTQIHIKLKIRKSCKLFHGVLKQMEGGKRTSVTDALIL